MGKLYDLARMVTATIGTGTITLGAAVSGFLTFALAGVADGDVVSYGIWDGANSEVGTGTYTAAGTTLSRTVTKSTNGNAAISLTGAAQVFITARAEDLTATIAAVQAEMEAATANNVAVTPAVQHFHPGMAKAWAYVTNSGTAYTIAASYNVASVTRISAGRVDVTLTTGFSSANYAAIAMPGVSGEYVSEILGSRTSSNVRIRLSTDAGVETDGGFSVVFYGDFA